MIPLRDTTKSRTFPFVNYGFMAVCGIVFMYELTLGPALRAFVDTYGIIPEQVSSTLFTGRLSQHAIITLFTSPFIHGGWFHLLGNMLYLYIFGDNVEDRLGHAAYVLFYLLCGIGSGLAQVYFDQHSAMPLIGASGAIAGVLGAYFFLYPRARVLTLIPLFIFFPVVELSALFFLGIWFLMQFIQGSLSAGSDGGGVAWWAHAGGFVVGATLLPIFLLAKRA